MTLFSVIATFLIALSIVVDAKTCRPIGLTTRGPPPTPPGCAVRCSNLGAPKCAVYYGQYRLFRNSCMISGHYCNTGERYKVVAMINCARHVCPVPCDVNDGETVCARSGTQLQVFNSFCEFQNFACTSRREWTREDCLAPTTTG